MDWLHTFFPFLRWIPLLNRESIRIDTLAGITAGVLALPQAIALATLAGMPPEYGLYTSIFPVVIAALYGSSWHSLSGPNTAVCIMITVTLSPFASPQTPQWIQYAITLTFLVGVIQLGFGVLRLGAVFNYFSHTVMVALVTSVGFIIIVQQFGNFMGVTMNPAEPIEDTILLLVYNASHANLYALTVGTITVLTGFVVKHYRPHWPHFMLAVIAGMIGSEALDLFLGSATVGIDKLGTLSLSALPLSAPELRAESFAEASEGLFAGAFLIAFLGLMQTAIIARTMATTSGQHVNMNQEVVGQGLSNLVGSFSSCFASCGSFNRSASNIDAGARTPLSALVSAVALGLLIVGAATIIRELPIAVMAGVLLLVGAALIRLDDIKRLMLVRGEARIVFLITLGVTLFGGLNLGVMTGIVLSIVGYLRSVSKPELQLFFSDEARPYLPPGVEKGTVLRVSGSLFFGSMQPVEQALSDIAAQDQRRGVLVLYGEHIQHMDITAADMLAREALQRRQQGGMLVLWFRNRGMEKILSTSGLREAVGDEHIYYVDRDGVAYG